MDLSHSWRTPTVAGSWGFHDWPNPKHRLPTHLSSRFPRPPRCEPAWHTRAHTDHEPSEPPLGRTGRLLRDEMRSLASAGKELVSRADPPRYAKGGGASMNPSPNSRLSGPNFPRAWPRASARASASASACNCGRHPIMWPAGAYEISNPNDYYMYSMDEMERARPAI